MKNEIAFNYHFGDEASEYSYFHIPYAFFTDPRLKKLSAEAKMLYGMMLDRMGLSKQNGWYDEQGRVYIYYTLDEVRERLNCGSDKAMKTLSELDGVKGVGLIERIKQGQGKPTRIYVKRFSTQALPTPGEEEQDAPDCSTGHDHDFSGYSTPTFSASRTRKKRGEDYGKSECNHTDLSQIDVIHTNLSIYPPVEAATVMMDRYDCREELREQIDYPTLKHNFPYDDVESLLELLVDVMCARAPTIRIGGETMPMSVVKERFRQLDSTHIEYVLDSMKNTTTKIHNIRAYLLTALYNAPVTIGPYYSAAVRHDFG